jgi:hypothetical protein
MLAHAFNELREMPVVEEKCSKLALLLNDFPFVLELWSEYLLLLRESNGTASLDVLRIALQCIGIDPRSGDIWRQAVEIAHENSAEFLRSACSIPLFNSLRRNHETHDETLRIQLQVSDSVIALEESWPDSSTIAHDDRCASSLQYDWDQLLQRMFRTLELEILPRELQLRRIDHAFCLVTMQLPFEDSNWLHHASFRKVHMEDQSGAESVLQKGIAATGSFTLWAYFHSFNRAINLQILSLPENEGRLIEQKLVGDELPKSRKSFRSIGKTAESSRVTDWKVYNQWALIEEGTIEDIAMTSKVLERGLACVPSNSFGYEKLAQTAERHFLSRHSEGEVLSIAEKRIDSAGRSNDRGSVACSWNRMLEYERRLGLLWTGKMETRAATATFERNMWYFQQSLRYRVGHLSTFQSREIEFVGFLRNISESVEEPRANVLEHRSDKLRRLEGPPSGKISDPPLPGSWTPFVACVNPHPPVAAVSPAMEDDICGPRVLRGAQVHKILRDDLVEARIARSDHHRNQIRKMNLHAESINTNGLPKQLGTLVSLIESETSFLDGTQIELLQRISIRWLMGALAGDLELGTSLKKNDRAAQ